MQQDLTGSTQVNEASAALQHSQAYYACIKALNTIGYFAAIYLTWRVITNQMDWQVSTGFTIVSGCWLALTRIKINHLLQTYFDVLSRIELCLPVLVGSVMSIVAAIAHGHPYIHYLALVEIFGWFYIYSRYRANQLLFIKQGHGPMPRGAWVSPPASVLRPGDLILTSGNIAKGLHETVGHAEMVLRMPDGTDKLFSSYMGRGAFIHDMESVTERRIHGHYIALHLKQRWTDEQAARATEIAEKMVATNRQWAERETEKYKRLISFLPLPSHLKTVLEKKIHVDGYDWFGTFMGRVTKDRWTCISGCLDLYHAMGVRTNNYGTGLLGFGTTLFDPIMPVRFLADPAFELIKAENASQMSPASPSKSPSPVGS